MARGAYQAKIRLILTVLTLVALLGATSACSRVDDDGDAPASVSVATSDIAAAERRITSVLTLDAVVVVSPFIRIVAPNDGVLVNMSKGRVGIIEAPGRAPVPVALPKGAEILSLLVRPGRAVTKGLPIINAQYTGLALQATVLPERIYRLYGGVVSARAQVKEGPGPFDTSVLGVPYPVGAITLPDASGSSVTAASGHFQAAVFRVIPCGLPDPSDDYPSKDASAETSTFPFVTSAPGDPGAGVVIIVKAPADLRLIEGAPGRVALVTADVTGVALPIEAVAGITQRGQVYVVKEDGRTELRDVTLGITDGSYVQITAGLAKGEIVRIPSPTMLDTE